MFCRKYGNVRKKKQCNLLTAKQITGRKKSEDKKLQIYNQELSMCIVFPYYQLSVKLWTSCQFLMHKNLISTHNCPLTKLMPSSLQCWLASCTATLSSWRPTKSELLQRRVPCVRVFPLSNTVSFKAASTS